MPPWFGHRYVTLALLAVTIGLLPLFFPSTYYFRVASLVWVSAFAAIGLNILMGQAGQVSLGHAGFFGVVRTLSPLVRLTSACRYGQLFWPAPRSPLGLRIWSAVRFSG